MQELVKTLFCKSGALKRIVFLGIFLFLLAPGSYGQQWQTLTSLTANRFQHAAAAYDGKIYVINGSMNDNTGLSSLLVYNVQNNSWTTGTAPSGIATRGGHAVSDGNGTIYFATGIGTGEKTLYKYVISSNTWSEVPGSSGRTAWNGTLEYHNGKLYFLGGEGVGVYTSLNIYDIASSTWSTGALIPDGGGMMHASAVIGNKIYMIGGGTGYSAGTQTVKVYDIASNTWTLLQ